MKHFTRTVNASGQDKASAILNSTKMTYAHDIYKRMDFARIKIKMGDIESAKIDLEHAAILLNNANENYRKALNYNISNKLIRLIEHKMNCLDKSAGAHIRKELERLCQAESIQ